MRIKTLPYRLLSLAAAASLSIYCPTHAQSTDSEDEKDVYELPAFEYNAEDDFGYRATNTIGVTRLNSPILEVPLNIQVVTEDFIEDTMAIDFTDSLRYSSGVKVAGFDNFWNNRQGTPFLRGYQISTIYRNGFRRQSNLSVRNVERVEVIKGAASIFFGEASPGGSVNYYTRRPMFDNTASSRVSMGSDGYYYGDVDVNWSPSEKVGVRVFGYLEENDGWRKDDSSETEMINAMISFRPAPGLAFNASFEHVDVLANFANGMFYGREEQLEVIDEFAESERDRESWSQFGNWAYDLEARGLYDPAEGRWAFFPQLLPDGVAGTTSGPGSLRDQSSNDITLEASWEVNEWFSARAAYNKYDIDYTSQFIWFDNISAIGLLWSDLNSYRNETADYETLQGDFVISLGEGTNWKSNITFGYEKFKEDTSQQNLQFDYSLSPLTLADEAVPMYGRVTGNPQLNYYANFDPTSMVPPDLRDIATGQPRGDRGFVSNERQGVYVSYQGDLFERAHVLLALRNEEFDGLNVNSGSTTSSDGTTPTAGVAFELNDETLVFASYSQNYEPQSGLTVQGPEALPEEGTPFENIEGEGFEVGAKTSWNDNTWSGTFSIYQVAKTNLALFDLQTTQADPRNAGLDLSNYVVRFFNQGGKLQTQGAELDFIYTPSENLQLLFNYSNMWEAEIKEIDMHRNRQGRLPDGTVVALPDRSSVGVRMERAPEHMANFWGKYTFTEGGLNGLSLGLGANYSSEYRFRGGNGVNAWELQGSLADSFVKFDAMASYAFKIGERDAKVSLNVRNVFDELYVDGYITFAPPRQIFTSFEIDF